MNYWGETPLEFLEASEQVRKAQENLRKSIQKEIDRQCYGWRKKVALLCRERADIRDCLQKGESSLALAKICENDAKWFPGLTDLHYADYLENPSLGLQHDPKDPSPAG